MSEQGLPLRRRLVVMATGAAATLFIVLILLGGFAVWTINGAGPPAKAGATTTVVLRQGAGLNEISSALEGAGVVRSAALFAAAAQLTGSAKGLKAGEYEFPSRETVGKMLARIRSGKVVRHFVTIPEGRTSEMVVDILMDNPLLTGAVAVPAEGAILPETYEIHRGEDRAAVLLRMSDARDKLLATLWAQRKDGLPFETPEQAVILASIVEKETGKNDERGRVASVFVNRLRQGKRLESDPTIIYGLTRGRPLGHGIRLSEKNAVNAYNTYFIDGLPPTPIANPGREAMAAVLDPPETDDLYFVANGTGGHTFAKTFDEHLQNVARLREIERTGRPSAEAAPVVEDELPPAIEPAAPEAAKPAAKKPAAKPARAATHHPKKRN
ncbi:endolytic transglycosylase MltG [soil metagenome]